MPMVSCSWTVCCTCTGEFEPHTGCWMGWPDSGYLWRDGAKPAQAQYAAVAKAISEFEPLTMFANAGEVSPWWSCHGALNILPDWLDVGWHPAIIPAHRKDVDRNWPRRSWQCNRLQHPTD